MKHLFTIVLFVILGLNCQAQNSLDFDGTNDFVQTTYPGVAGSAARTIEAWINTSANTDPNQSGKQKVIADFGTFVTGGRFTFNLLWGGAIRIEVGGSGLSGKRAVNDGMWHHVAVVYNPTATNSYELYVDGSLDTSGTISTSINTVLGVNARIGQRVDGTNSFEGKIDEVRFWNIARTVSQLRASMNSELCNNNNLKAYYQFSQGTAGGSNTGITSLTDISGNSYTGTLTNFALTGSSSNWASGAALSAAGGSTSSSIMRGACGTYVSPSGKYTWSNSGNYKDTIPNSAGCDSVISINLMVDQVNLGTTLNGFTLSALENSASYQWLDCANNYAVINGATAQSFVATLTGAYAVELTKGGCVDTSGCTAVNSVGFEDLSSRFNFKLFPNPSLSGEVNIEFSLGTNGQLNIADALGRTVLFRELNGEERVQLNLKPGYYSVFVGNGKNSERKKLIVVE